MKKKLYYRSGIMKQIFYITKFSFEKHANFYKFVAPVMSIKPSNKLPTY